MRGISKFFSSIRFRILATYMILTTIALLFIGVSVVLIVQDSLLAPRISRYASDLATYAPRTAEALYDSDKESFYAIVNKACVDMDCQIIVFDKNNSVLFSSDISGSGMLAESEVLDTILNDDSATNHFFHQIDTSKAHFGEWGLYSVQQLMCGNVNLGSMVSIASAQDVVNTLNSVAERIIVSFAILLILMLVACILLSRRITKPIVELTESIKSATATHQYDKRIQIKAKGEIAELVTAFNLINAELNSHDTVRDKFVGNASHELKTPLASMKILAESILTQEHPDPEIMLDFLKDINTEVDRLNNIVQDLLAVAREDSGNVAYDLASMNIDDIIMCVVKRLKPIADEKRIQLLFSPQELVYINGDERRLDRVFTNLIENAIKYTEKGAVSIEVVKENPFAIIRVHDTGIGIPSDSIPKLFERFYRVDTARSRARGGTGLGLSLADEIVTRHGGHIDVSSTLGVGSTFSVYLPLIIQ